MLERPSEGLLLAKGIRRPEREHKIVGMNPFQYSPVAPVVSPFTLKRDHRILLRRGVRKWSKDQR